ncbi:hypothetical protein J437_LFUL003712 [Ladona fulva]|uniref:Bardet-Biedl syndrome 2 protein homolog n=1 Tax=Ladona fulva TaxID=123851 RepID=A0A8K0JWR7_LADFU|nr:hypothetical protein J437_LFUL003712 [Ladona fulva]
MDVFFKEVKDGVNSITVGKFGHMKDAIALIGGNCCVQGFDNAGNEVFWNVVGDRVSSMALVDFDRDGQNELVVGSTDYEITAFKNEHIVSEVTETEVITSLVPLDGVTFAYALSNGTIGLYDQLQRWWRVKSKNQAVSILGYDIDGDGVEELITGWSNGKVDARNSRTGDIVFTENMKHGVAGLAKADLVQAGRYDLVTCSENGEVIGYRAYKRGGYLRKWQPGVEEETIQDMMLKKQDLLYEMKNYEGNAKYASKTESTSSGISRDSKNEEYGVIPLLGYLFPNKKILAISLKPHVELVLSTNNSTIIRLVLVYGEGIFNGETYVIHPKESELSNEVKVPLFPPRDVPVDFHLKALVGYPESTQFHVFELTRQIPRFSMYKVENTRQKSLNSYVSFNIRERVERVMIWMAQNFILPSTLSTNINEICYSLTSLRTGQESIFSMSSNGNVELRTNEVGFAGDLIQSLAIFLNLDDLQVSDTQLFNLKRMSLKQIYSNLKKSTEEIMQTHKIYCERQEELKNMLTELNLVIQKASRLRVGESKSNLIQLCHTALENNNFHSLTKIITTGLA